jgi:hypothetical protein
MLEHITKLNPWLFLLCFTLGLYISYAYGDKIKHIVKFPTPVDSENLIYKKKEGTCYMYKLKEIKCPGKCESLVSEKILK